MRSNTDLKRDAHEVRLDRALVPGPNAELGVRRLRADLEVGIPQCLADRVNTNVVSGLEQVDVGEITFAGRVQLSPLAVGIKREELGRVLDRRLRAGLGIGGHAGLDSIDGTVHLVLS